MSSESAEGAANPLGIRTRRGALAWMSTAIAAVGIVAGGVSWLANKTHIPRSEYQAHKEEEAAARASIRQQMAVQHASAQLTGNQLRRDVEEVKADTDSINSKLERMRNELIREVRKQRR